MPLAAKILAGGVAAYALSPIDLIPDFIPVLGLLDDLLIVPAGIWLARRMIAPDVLAELREQARVSGRPRSVAGAIFVIGTWLAAVLAAILVMVRR